MKTIVSLALGGLMSISTLLPALAAQETENISMRAWSAATPVRSLPLPLLWQTTPQKRRMKATVCFGKR